MSFLGMKTNVYDLSIGKQRQKDHEFKANLSQIVRLFLKRKENNQKNPSV